MIAQVCRGNAMPDLVSYLFGPGHYNEHVDQHLIAGYADAVFTANDRLWRSEPGTQRRVRGEARELGWQVEYPHSRWGTDVPHGYVWHCSLSIRAGEGPLTDAQWTQAAHALVDALGFSSAGGKAPCRWIAVRHGPSAEGNDHIHIAVNLVREDGTKASTWNDYRKAGAVCQDLEERFGLQPVPGRMTHRTVPEPSRKDQEISAARGDPEPLRVRLERIVRACAAAAASEATFVALARANGLLIRPRYTQQPGTPAVTGYAVADRDGRQARSRLTGVTGPIWFGGGKLAADLSLPALRRRWETSGVSPTQARIEALAAWSAASTLDTRNEPARKPQLARLEALAGDPAVAADLLAAAATGYEQAVPGPLSRAARHMARAAQAAPPVTRRPEVAAVVSDMASTFLAITRADTGDALTLVREVALLVDACVAKSTATAAVTREATQASVLVHASVGALSQAATRQARTALSATSSRRSYTSNSEEDVMTTLTHEEEFLSHLTATGVLGARIMRAMTGQPAGTAADVETLKAAGYTAQTPFDEHLRRELGEQRWGKYVADPARIVCAAQITDAARAGRDVPAMLSKVCEQRAWEDDARSPAQSIVRVLSYRIKRELSHAASHQKTTSIRTDGGTRAPAPSPVASSRPMPRTPWDDRLKALLGERRWDQYATDERRRDVATQLANAAADGHDIGSLITEAVNSREWEDDPTSPSRRVASVLLYRIKSALASGEFKTVGNGGQLPSGIAQLVARSAAPASGTENGNRPAQADQTPSRTRDAHRQPDRGRG